MDLAKDFLTHEFFGFHMYEYVLLVAVGALNEFVQRKKSVKAQSLLQALGNFLLGIPFLRFPGLRQLFELMATPQEKPAPPAPVKKAP